MALFAVENALNYFVFAMRDMNQWCYLWLVECARSVSRRFPNSPSLGMKYFCIKDCCDRVLVVTVISVVYKMP